MENYTKFIKYYGKSKRFGIFGFFIISLIAGLLEFVGIAMVYPFVLFVVKPDIIVNSHYYAKLVSVVHIQNTTVLALCFGLFAAGLFIFKSLFMILNLYLQNRFINNWKFDIKKEIMKYYMFSAYKNSLQTSQAEKLYNMNFLTDQTLDNFIFRGISLLINSMIVAMILGLLFVKFPIAALVTTAFVIVTITSQSKFFKKKSTRISKEISKTSMRTSNTLMESVNNLKEIKILSAESYFYSQYLQSQRDYNNVLISNNFYATIPPYIVEILVVLALLLLGGIISLQNFGNDSWILTSYAIVTVAIFRVAPALNRIQSSLNSINSSRELVKTMLSLYENTDYGNIEKKSSQKIEFNNSIRLENVNFSYREGRKVINEFSIKIKKGEFVGIIGASGAGKSTFADILMGLLPVDDGHVFVDDTELSQSNFSALRKLVGYVPQQINILDASIKENVAWGIEIEEVDDERVIEALKMAQLWEVVSEYEHGIDSRVIIGSNGLSQGQKQRLAIARAFYRNPEILIFDEATSALDVQTEHEITQMLNSFKGDKTIIAIAHRLSTLKSCDRLIYLKAGRIVDAGSFQELSDRHADFEKLIKYSKLSNM